MSVGFGGKNNIFGDWSGSFAGTNITEKFVSNSLRNKLVVAETGPYIANVDAGRWVTYSYSIDGIPFVDPEFIYDAIVVGCSLSSEAAKGYIGGISYQVESVAANIGQMTIKCSYLSSDSDTIDLNTRFYIVAQYYD